MAIVDSTGVHALSLSEHRADLEQRFRDTLGTELSLDAETPQGQIIGIMAMALTEVDEAFVQMGNAANLNAAAGTQLDALGTILNVTRRAATYSRVTGTLAGTSGTLVPAGSRARTTAGDIFQLRGDTSLSPLGVAAEFQAVEPGAIEAAAGTLTEIVTVIPGWDSVTNSSAASIGRPQQSDADYRATYRTRTARNATSSTDAILAALESAGATKSKIYENSEGESVTVQGWTLQPHSILVISQGASDSDTTRAVLSWRGMGVQPMTVIRGAARTAQNITDLIAVTSGTIAFGPDSYTGIDFSGATDGAGIAAALTTDLAPALSKPVAVFDWDYFLQTQRWLTTQSQDTYTTGTVEDLLGMVAYAIPGPFIRPSLQDLTVTTTVAVRSGFPANGLAQLRKTLIDTASAYDIGDQVWLNDFLRALETIPGTRVTALSVQRAGSDISAVAVPPDTLWRLPSANITITLTGI